VLDARKAISQTERQNYILKIRELAKAVAELYVEIQEKQEK
jgi:glycyl-tRNA synthetase alpha chain